MAVIDSKGAWRLTLTAERRFIEMAFDYEYSPSRDRGSCSTVIVGKAASATGYVLVAHNEDDYDCVIQVHKVPRIRHEAGETIRFADAKAVIP